MLTLLRVHKQRRKDLQSPFPKCILILCQWEKSQVRTVAGLTGVPTSTLASRCDTAVLSEVGGEAKFDCLFQNCTTKRRGESPLMMWDVQLPEKEIMAVRKAENGKQCQLQEAYME